MLHDISHPRLFDIITKTDVKNIYQTPALFLRKVSKNSDISLLKNH